MAVTIILLLKDPGESDKCLSSAIQEFREGQHVFELRVNTNNYIQCTCICTYPFYPSHKNASVQYLPAHGARNVCTMYRMKEDMRNKDGYIVFHM